MSEAKLVDISKMTMQQRMVKSAEELELIRNGAQVADIGGAAWVDCLLYTDDATEEEDRVDVGGRAIIK